MTLKKSAVVSFLTLSCVGLVNLTPVALAQEGHMGMDHSKGQMGHSAPAGQTGQTGQTEAESVYMKETMAAMDVMHKDMMDKSRLNGVPDRDFLVMMIPHHQGALAMAEIYLKHAEEAKVKKLAREIIAAQKKEIAQMEKWISAGVGAKK